MFTAEQELRGAARLIRKHGWTQGVYVLGDKLCMGAACAEARGVFFDCGPSPGAHRYLIAVTGCGTIEFNDDHCHTKSDAIAALENSGGPRSLIRSHKANP